jgi:hypothetical protein
VDYPNVPVSNLDFCENLDITAKIWKPIAIVARVIRIYTFTDL